MTIASDSSPCAVCRDNDRQIVQPQSLALLNRDEPCITHFGYAAIAAISNTDRDPGDAPVVISSYVSKRPIAHDLLERGITPSRIRLLYSDMPC